MRVLIVEDEALIAHALRQCLQAAGFEVIGLAATEPVGRHLSARERPDAAVFVTGNGRDIVAGSGLNAAYVEKPFNAQSIALAVRAAQHLMDTGALPPWAPSGVRQIRS